jgi:hypothetical protein
MRTFDTGATRDSEGDKLDYDGFLSPLALHRYAEYMHGHRVQADGTLRASDNWQHGIPQDVYRKSLWRHFLDVWRVHRGYRAFDGKDGHEITLDEALCAVIFNAMGLLHEHLKEAEDVACVLPPVPERPVTAYDLSNRV